MRTALRLFLLPVLVIGLAACADRDDTDADVEIDAPFDDAIDPDLIGTWVLAEQAGAAPDVLVTVTFTTTGDYIVLTEGRAGQHQYFSMAGANIIAVSETPGGVIEQYEYEVGTNRLTLTVPGTEASTVLERRPDLLENRPELVPQVDADPDPGTVAPPPQQMDEDAPTREEVGRDLDETDEEWGDPEP